MGGIPIIEFFSEGNQSPKILTACSLKKNGEMVHEYDALYASPFRRPKTHIAIVNAPD